MDIDHINNELQAAEREIMAADRTAVEGREGLYFKSLKNALGELRYTPVEYAWNDPKVHREMKKRRELIVDALETMIARYPVAVRYQVVGLEGGTQEYDDEQEFIKAMKKYGIRHTGYSDSSGRMEALRDQPQFSGLLGPMHGGPKVVRYETQEAYNALSR